MWKKSFRNKLLLLALLPLLAGCKSLPAQTVSTTAAAPTVTEQATTEAALPTPAPTEETTLPDPLWSEPLILSQTQTGDNQYTFTWSDGHSQAYTLWQLEGDSWCAVATVPGDSPRTWSTGHLAPFTQYVFRVTGQEGQESEPLTLETDQRAVYSTVWPLMELTVYADPEGTQPLGTAPAGSAWCVISQQGELFSVRFGSSIGYLDSRYCLINLPDYLGTLCSYEITNASSSIFKVHGYDIPQVSGTVLQGYEHIALENGEYLVPYMFPCANKLIPVAQAFIRQGYRIRIYDSFRPHEATTAVYNLTQSCLQEVLDNGQTMEAYMTDAGRYAMGNFLAPGISNHNRGISLDLTLETLEGELLPMQTDIHDLSWYSEMGLNNKNAQFLREQMTAYGFQTLRSGSEWWHYQDEESRDTLGYRELETGVSPQCWMLDDTGWRYRYGDGTYAVSCTLELEGSQYTFDRAGYLEE